MSNIEDELNNEINLLESKKTRYKVILIFLENENIEKISKKNFFMQNTTNEKNHSKNILKFIKESYCNDYSILYFLNYNLNLEINVLEEFCLNNNELNVEDFKKISYNNKIFNLNVIKNLNNMEYINNNNENNNINNFRNTDTKIIILKKKDKIYYIKNKNKNKENKNKTKKIQK